MTPDERAEKSAAAMWASDHASKWLGLSLDAVGPGTATLSMTIQKHHLQGHGICHGGFIFTLADSAFAFACNSYNRVAVAQDVNINFLSPGELGEELRAVAKEAGTSGRSSVFDVKVTGGDGRTVALFRGLSREVRGQHFEEDA